MWADTSDAQYAAYIAPLVGYGEHTYLAANDEIVTRTQHWLDRLDSAIRVAHPEELKDVPKPRARLAVDTSANAFVAPLPLCYTMPTSLGGKAGEISAVHLDTATGTVSAWPSALKCVEVSGGEDKLSDFVSWFNSFPNADGCRFAITGKGSEARLSVGSGCTQDDDIKGLASAQRIVLMTPSNQITVHTGLISQLSEGAVVAVLAHELGHYYRSHLLVHSSQYDYFYTQERENPTHKPKAEEDKREFGKMAIAASGFLGSKGIHTAIENQKLRSELFFAAASVVHNLCEQPASCSKSCADTIQDLNAQGEARGLFPYQVSDEAMGKAYLSFEKNFEACAREVSVLGVDDIVTAQSISWNLVKTAIVAPQYPQWAAFNAEANKSIQKFNLGIYQRVFPTPAPQMTLWDALVKASTDLNLQDQESAVILKKAYAQKLGYYTTEQEADDSAVEWIGAIGVDPSLSVNAMHVLFKDGAGDAEGMIVGYEECTELWKKNWLNAEGEYMFVPIGDFTDDHHSLCYRMFNFEREIASHKHEAAQLLEKPTFSESDWARLQSLATQHGKDSEAKAQSTNALSESVMSMRRMAGFGQCAWAPRQSALVMFAP